MYRDLSESWVLTESLDRLISLLLSARPRSIACRWQIPKKSRGTDDVISLRIVNKPTPSSMYSSPQQSFYIYHLARRPERFRNCHQSKNKTTRCVMTIRATTVRQSGDVAQATQEGSLIMGGSSSHANRKALGVSVKNAPPSLT
jgi:hypothetical protein